MRERVTALAQWINALSLRERLFVAVAVLVLCGACWQALLMGPLEAREKRASAALESLTERIARLNASLEATAAGLSSGMPGRLKRLHALKAQLTETKEAVRVFTSDLVDPAQMRFALEDLLAKHQGLTVVSISNLPAESLFEDSEASDGEGGPRLYRHGVKLVLEGSYLALLQYLGSIEALPWRFFWSQLEITVDDYPRNRIVLELNTLSLAEEWIGV